MGGGGRLLVILSGGESAGSPSPVTTRQKLCHPSWRMDDALINLKQQLYLLLLFRSLGNKLC